MAERNGWKIAAIIFIIIAIAEAIFIAWAYNYGTQAIENENECIINVCADYDTYFYDDYESICYCYENHEIVKQEYMRG